MQTTPSTPDSDERRERTPTLPDMLWEVADLAGGVVITLLPLLVLAVPSVVLFLVLPALVLLAVAAVPVAVAAAVMVPAYLLSRAVRSARARVMSRRRGVRRSVPPRAAWVEGP